MIKKQQIQQSLYLGPQGAGIKPYTAHNVSLVPGDENETYHQVAAFRFLRTAKTVTRGAGLSSLVR